MVLVAATLFCAGALLNPTSRPAPRSSAARSASFASTLQAAVASVSLSLVLSGGGPSPALAIIGEPTQVKLSMQKYEEVTCPPELAQGRAGGALGAGAGGAGIAQKCVQVKAAASNPSGNTLKDTGVFGVVISEAEGMSVLGNGQDGKNDAGQFAMIDEIKPGDSIIDFTFVSQQSTACRNSRSKDPETGKLVEYKCPVGGTEPLLKLKFEKLKAIAYPGGDRYKTYNECEQNEFAEGC